MTPAPPPGYSLDKEPVKPPPGYTMDSAQPAAAPAAKPAAAPLSTGQKVWETSKALGGAAVSAVSGAAKGAGHTLMNLSDFQKFIHGGPLIDRMFPEQAKNQQALRGKIDKFLEPNDKEKATYMAEQVAEFFIPTGTGEIKAAATAPRWVKMLVSAGRDALDVGMKTFVQTKDPEAALKAAGVAAPIGAAGSALPIAKKAARSVYEAELRPGQRVSLAQRGEIVERGLKAGLPIESKSISTLEEGINANKEIINRLTKDPSSPYSARTMPIDTVLNPVDKWIAKVERVDKGAAKTLRAARKTWAESMGYKEAVPESQAPTGLIGANGKPLTKTVAAEPGVTDVSVVDAQRLKEDLYAIINSPAYGEGAEPGTMVAGRKLAAHGIKKGIEQAIPEAPIKQINHAIGVDILLKDTINSAIKKHPSWIKDWAVFVLGAGAGELSAGHLGGGVEAVGALTLMAARNPRIMSRLAIALERSGDIPSASTLTQAVGGVMAASREPSPRGKMDPPHAH